MTTVSTQELLTKIDHDTQAGELASCHTQLQQLYDDGHREAEVLWRLARSHYLTSLELSEKAAQQPHVEVALTYTKAAVDTEPDNWAAHKWHGIVLGGTGKFRSTKENVAQSFVIRDHLKKAIELNPNDPTALFTMGVWCWKVLQITWLERQAATLLFGAPPTSTYEECENYFLRSQEVDPKQTHNMLALGDLYYQQKKWEEAKKWYAATANCTPLTQKATREIEEAQRKLGKCESKLATE